MYIRDKSTRTLGLVITTAMAGALLSGCASASMSDTNLAANQAEQAEQASADGKVQRAISLAENAVRADPNNAAHRAQLGSTYLDAGRFASAAASFDDAMALGDSSARTALSGALALTGEGKLPQAAALLNANEGKIAKADLGLAVALAGQPERGIHIMSNAIRGGENTVKMRQNLAYAYALGGQWRKARLMAEQDVPAGMVSDRIGAWAETVHPQAYQYRVAKLLQVPATVIDAGQPAVLALVAPSGKTAVAVAAAPAPKSAPLASAELPALTAPALTVPALTVKADPTPYKVRPAATASAKSDNFDDAFAASAPLAAKADVAPRYTALRNDAKTPAIRTVSNPVVQQIAATPAAKPAAAASKAKASTIAASGSHLVQLGSFNSEKRARLAWDIYVSRYPELKNKKMVISQAKVHGKNYWRVSAGDFAKSASAQMCSKVKASGKGCLTWASNAPLPGAIKTGVQLARR